MEQEETITADRPGDGDITVRRWTATSPVDRGTEYIYLNASPEGESPREFGMTVNEARQLIGVLCRLTAN